ncbi:MAG: hypothetical protein WBM40_01490 [Thiohalocapsa sp.]
MSLVGTLIAGSLLLFAGLGLAALFLSGRSSAAANADDQKDSKSPRGRL